MQIPSILPNGMNSDPPSSENPTVPQQNYGLSSDATQNETSLEEAGSVHSDRITEAAATKVAEVGLCGPVSEHSDASRILDDTEKDTASTALAVNGVDRNRRLTTLPTTSDAEKICQVSKSGGLSEPDSSVLRKDVVDDVVEDPTGRLTVGQDIPARIITVTTTDLPNGLNVTNNSQLGEQDAENSIEETTLARRRRNTRRLTTIPEETGKTPLNDTLVDIANKSSRRSLRKRRLTKTVTHPLELNSENISPSSQAALTSVESPTETDPSSSPVGANKKRISFNETVECWNPILQEMTWRDICDDIREVPLLKPVPKSKKRANSNNPRNKRRKHAAPVILENPEPVDAENVVRIAGICVPTTLKAPSNLRPVLKPSPLPVAPPADVGVEPSKRKIARRRLVLKNMKRLLEKYGADFSYKGCLKVDGRYHCPDEGCMDNDHRGYNTENVLRNHIKTNHLNAECPPCEECGKSFRTQTKLAQHKLIHDLPFPCIDCDKSFKTAALLNDHTGCHTRFGCLHCLRTFRSKNTLAHHFRDMPYRCVCCETTLSCSTMLTKHEEESEHVYGCPICSEYTSNHSAFWRHARTVHYGETTSDGRYQCSSCPRTFSVWNNLYRHMTTKHGLVQPVVSLKAKTT